MRGFTQTLVNSLFGWIRILVEGIWDLLFSNDTQKWVQWVADNWLALVVFLCFCGVVLDYLVWFLRWRPYYVWATSIRRMRRFFGGGKNREDKQVSREPKRQRQLPAPMMEQAPEVMPYEAENDLGTAWEEQNWDQTATWEQQNDQSETWEQQNMDQTAEWEQQNVGQTAAFIQPEPVYSRTPAMTADTIMARPRKVDYQEQYVRRFARPEPEPQAASYWQEDPGEEWTEPQQVYLPEQEAAAEEESWAPEPALQSPDEPIHPGIDYQALSRQYGWHQDVQNTDAQTLKEEDFAQEEQLKEQARDSWNFSGLENFSPYRVPAPPTEREQRTERARKARTDSTPMSRVKSGLSRIAKHAGKVLTVDDEEANRVLDGLPPPIDKRRAFHAPVYPNRPGMDAKKSPDFREDD